MGIYNLSGGMRMMVVHDHDTYDIYYQLTGFAMNYPFMYAFGLPDSMNHSAVVEIGKRNAENYLFLFEEE